MESLRNSLEKITQKNKQAKKLRRYILVEAVYQADKIHIITVAMGHALATEGGFCTGNARVIDHQRLSSSDYVFSASLPPRLSDIKGLEVVNDPLSPIIFLTLNKSTGSSKGDLQLLEDIADDVLKEDSVFIVTSKRSTLDKCKLPVGIRYLSQQLIQNPIG
ncbi:hypothetical protein RND71_016440 [Anisodus tanguticus]|uniref:Uncharacterized protein n=1 Tax=Anisodus tanguticus TaxID=243964 RepID=A0AAE1S8I7_9SOLA|nr:hypothetical protein RND71_016440 [Anisodus tanguticus]